MTGRGNPRRAAGGGSHKDEALLKKRRLAKGGVEVGPRGADVPPAVGKSEDMAAGSAGGVEGRIRASPRLQAQRGGGVEDEGLAQNSQVRSEALGRGEGAAMRGGLIEVGRGHHITRTGSVIWCKRCGGHAEARRGVVLAGACAPIRKGEKSGRAYRRSLLMRRRHPITKVALEEENVEES